MNVHNLHFSIVCCDCVLCHDVIIFWCYDCIATTSSPVLTCWPHVVTMLPYYRVMFLMSLLCSYWIIFSMSSPCSATAMPPSSCHHRDPVLLCHFPHIATMFPYYHVIFLMSSLCSATALSPFLCHHYVSLLVCHFPYITTMFPYSRAIFVMSEL